MSRTPARFTQADVTRTNRAARQASAGGVEVRPDVPVPVLRRNNCSRQCAPETSPHAHTGHEFSRSCCIRLDRGWL
jgi:hypothetical protein